MTSKKAGLADELITGLNKTVETSAIENLQQQLKRMHEPVGVRALQEAMRRVPEVGTAFDLRSSGARALEALARPWGDVLKGSLALRGFENATEMQRKVSELYSLRGLDGLASAFEKVGAGSALEPVLTPYLRVREDLLRTFGAERAGRWDRVAPRAALASIAALSEYPPRSASLLVYDASAGAALSWVDEDEGAEAELRTVSLQGDASDASSSQRIVIAPGSAINCMRCGEPFDLNIGLWLIGTQVFFQGEMIPACANCSDSIADWLDVSEPAPLRVVRGGGEGDGIPSGVLTVVRNIPTTGPNE